MQLAPCVAVIGPANAGKSTLLSLLDEQLQKRFTAAYIIKGNPDGSGRYVFRSPNLRELPHVKGHWGVTTIAHICESVRAGRRNLEIALLDFGGKHNPVNDRMLKECSHYIVVSRLGDSAGEASWISVAQRNGLVCLAKMCSVARGNEPGIKSSSNGLDGIFRFDVGPEENANDVVIQALVEKLAEIARPLSELPYINLNLNTRWEETDIPTVKGLLNRIQDAASKGEVALGGAAPIWAYLVAMHRALPVRKDLKVLFFNPTLPQPLVEIPQSRRSGEFPEGLLNIRCSEQSGEWQLDIEIMTEDKFLPSYTTQHLAFAPFFNTMTGKKVRLNGARPNWLAGVYARWLFENGAEKLSVFDGTKNGYVQIW